MNIIDTLKAKAFSALCCCEVLLNEDSEVNRELAISWYGEGVGLIKAIHALLGSYVDTKSLEQKRDKLSDRLWPGQNAL